MVLNSQRFTIVVWLVLGSSVSAQTVQDEHPKRVDIQGDPLPEGVAVRCGTVRYRHPGWYKQVDFLPGTHHFVVSPKGYSPIIWDAVSGKMVRRFDHRGHVACVRLMPGSGNVVMLTLDINNETRMCRAWFTMPHDGGGRQLRWKEAFTEHSVKFALSPDAHILAVGTYHGMLTFRNLETGKELNSELVIDGEVSWIDWSPGGDRIAVAGRGGAAILKWDSAKQEVEILTRIKRAQVVRFSNDGSLLAVGSERKSGPAVIWDATTGAMIRQVGNVDANYYREGLCFSSDDSVLYVPNNYGKQVEAFDVKTGELQRSFPVPRTPPGAVAISDDGRFLVSVGSESQIAVWDLTTGELISDRFPGHAERAGDLTFMPDGKKLVSGDSRGVIRVWNSYTGTQLHKFEHDHWVAGLGVSPTGDQILSVGLDETVRTWELSPPREVLRSEGHGRLGSNDICAAAYTLDGKDFLSFGRDFNLVRRDAKTGEETNRSKIRPSVMELREDDDVADRANKMGMLDVNSVQFDNSRSRLFLGTAGAVFGYNTLSGEEVFEYAPANRVRTFVLSPDESLLATVSLIAAANPENSPSYVLDIVELPARKVLHTVVIPDFSWHLKFANDSRTLGLCCGEWRPAKSRVFLQLFDARSGELGVRIPVGEFQINQLAFSPDDQRIATSHTNTEIRIWNLADFKPKH